MLLVSSIERVVHSAGHAVRFLPLEPKEVPEELVHACLQAGCFPYEVVEKIVTEPVKRGPRAKFQEKTD
jgi:hypothetical protein